MYMIGTMIDCVNSMEYLDFSEEYYSNHRPMKISLDLRMLGKVAIDVSWKSNKKILCYKVLFTLIVIDYMN